MEKDLKKLIREMTLEEKAGLCSGQDFWHTKGVERLGIPAVMVSDGPHGLRKQAEGGDHLGINESIKAVCFPAGCATAASFDRDLLYRLGETIGNECQAENVSVILGPAVNIKRSPLCGRNFEYYSEDPYLAGEIAKSHIGGVQSKNVGTSMKHYLANNQEHRRMSSSSEMDERTLREIYMPAFETAVKEVQPWTIMCSYNRINGEYASESRHFLSDVLRDEWGFEGYVMSDWGAVNDRVKGLAAGLELEMPASGGVNDARIVEAVKNGQLDEAVLDQAVERILKIVQKYIENRKPDTVWDKEADHQLAAQISAESMILLKNDEILPLKKEDKIAFIGEFAEKPRYQGGGSSHINAFKVTSAWETVKDSGNVTYAKGYGTEKDVINEDLEKEAVENAKNADVAVIFAGLPDLFESEGYDRSHMRMPECQNHLIEEVLKVQPNTVIVLHNGSPVEMPWINDVKAVLEVYLGGQAVGQATTDVLFGKVNPSGKLPETFPLKLEDNPSYLYYGGEKDKVEYREGIFVGYRYYDKKKMDVLFPFGYGLSYTTFEITGMTLDKEQMKDTEEVVVTVDVKNTGDRAGKEVVQIYVKAESTEAVNRPVRELREFAKVELQPGETKTLKFTLSKRAFACYQPELGDWYVPTGSYVVEAAQSSRKICCAKELQVISTQEIPQTYTVNTTFGDLLANEKNRELLKPFMEQMAQMIGSGDDQEEGAVSREMENAMINYMPLRGILSFGGGAVTYDDLLKLTDKMNEK